MRAAVWLGASGAILALMAGGGAAFAESKLKIASGHPEASAYAVGVGLSSLIKIELLPKEKIDLHVQESAGAVANVRLLEAGDAQFAILPSAIGHAARLGTGSFAGKPPAKSFRAIATLWRDALHLVIREDDVATGTIEDLARLKDQKLFLGEATTGMMDINRLLLADLDLDADETFELAIADAGDGISAIKEGEADVFSAAVPPPKPIFDSVFDDAAFGLRLLNVTDVQMAKANGNHWLWTPYIIEAATYPGQNEDVSTMALSNILVARTDVEEDVVYAITKSIFENLPYLERVDPLMANLSLDRALAGMAMPLHPGALRYYYEIGLIPEAPSEGEAVPPIPAPIGQDAEQPSNVPVERYPDADVAGDPPFSAGGPLRKTMPDDQATTAETDEAVPKVGERPTKSLDETASQWRRRATF